MLPSMCKVTQQRNIKKLQFSFIHPSPNALWTWSLQECVLAQAPRAYLTLCIEHEELVIGFQESACVRYVDSRLLLVPCQHPDLDASFVKGFYRLGDPLLQTIFNASST